MSAPASTTGRPAVAAGGGGDGFVNLVRSEWLKLWSVRATGWSLLAAFVVTVGISVLATWGTMQGAQSGQPAAGFDATSLTLTGLGFGQLAVAVLGAMAISSEYSTGGIRTTLTAAPHRVRLLLAKAAVLVVAVTATGVVTCFASFFVGRRFLLEQFQVSLGDDGVLRALLGGALYLAASSMYGFALGTLLRHTAGAITVAVALLLVLPPLAQLLPGASGASVYRHFTAQAGQQVTNAHAVPGQLTPWVGLLWFCLEFAVVLVVGALLLRRRDA